MDKQQRAQELREDLIVYLWFLAISFSCVLVYILATGARPIYILHSFMGLLVFFISRFSWGASRCFTMTDPEEEEVEKGNKWINLIIFIFKIIMNLAVFYFLSIIIFIFLTYLFFYTNEFFVLTSKLIR